MYAYIAKTSGRRLIKPIIILVLVIVLIVLVRRGWKGISKALADLKTEKAIDDVVKNTTPTDGSEIDTPAIEEFEARAKTLAQGQYNAMKGFGTNEEALFTPILPLNGAQLCKVYQAYGVKAGKDLFGWYADELGTSAWIPFESNIVGHDLIEGCEAYTDMCTETDAMRAVWNKSGLPLTF